jgi:aspartate/methionine/tyrosine aminotransferase
MQIADRISRLGVEGAFAVLQQARALEAQGKHIVHLEIGEPDFPTPQHIVEAGKQALEDGWTHYGPTMGLPDLREAIAQRLASTHGLEISPNRIGIMPGAKPALFFAMMAVLEKGDEVIYPDPGFPIYASMIRFLEAVPKPIPLLESRGFSFDLDRLKDSITPKTRMLILNSPHNPTGGVIPAADIRAIADMVRGRDITVISDEIYATICFDEAPLSIASLEGMQQQTVIVDGFSKSHAMTGWRLGYGVYPDHLTDAISKLVVNSNSCTASFTQKAGIAAIKGPQSDCDAMVTEFRRRRDVFCGILNSIKGFACQIPTGAFYAFPRIVDTGFDARLLSERLLTEAGVACLSGTAFGQYGEGYLRFSLANSLENLELAGERIRTLLEG